MCVVSVVWWFVVVGVEVGAGVGYAVCGCCVYWWGV